MVPPSLDFMTETFPYILPNKTLDRTIPRCKLCDLIAADDRAATAQNPPPGSNIKEDIEHAIAAIEKRTTEGKATEQDKEDMAALEKDLDDVIWLTELRIHEAWLPHWEIWGPAFEKIEDEPEEPQRLLGIIFDNGEDSIDWGV